MSILTSAGMAAGTAVATWATTKGVVAPGDANAFANGLVGLAAAAAATGIGWFKAQKWTQTAIIATVNSDAVPGVKVVSSTSPSPEVTEPRATEVKK